MAVGSMEDVRVMPSYRARARFLVLVFLVAIALVAWVGAGKGLSGLPHEARLRVVFFDVGQGDSIFIESPTGAQVLIDGGPGRAVLRNLSRELGFFDRSIDMVVATHEDKDHVGGLPDVFRRYDVTTLLRTENQGDSGAARLIDTLPTDRGARIVYARRDMAFDLGGGATLTILFPDRDPSDMEANNSSIVAKLTYGESSFLFTGDSPQQIEKYLVGLNASALQSDVLKAGHHGSRTSSAPVFVEDVHPAYAIISAGKDNRYGHPHKETLDTFSKYGVQVVSTAEEGSITFESDGKEPVRIK